VRYLKRFGDYVDFEINDEPSSIKEHYISGTVILEKFSNSPVDVKCYLEVQVYLFKHLLIKNN
jgi:hypothetical protein